MANAKQELFAITKNLAKVKCASISFEQWGATPYKANLKVGHTTEEFLQFMDKLDFVYDNRYGTHELHGTVWLEDGTWLVRKEYDGSEWWEYVFSPEIPEECL